jgi:glycosyltransferase involved in cell wall biosynthesis
MHIALLHYAVPPVVGGVERVLAAQADLLADAGHKVQVLAARGEIWRDDIPVHLLPLADSIHPAILEMKGALNVGEVPPAFALVRDQLLGQLAQALAGVDLLIAHNVASLNKNLPLTAALHTLTQRPGAPALILWHHDLAWTTPRYRAELHDAPPWNLLCTDWPWATQVVISALRQAELAQLLGVPPERIHVVPNGVDVTDFFKLDPATLPLVERLGLLEPTPLLLLPVRLTPRKNIELALRMLAPLREQLYAARLLVTGPLGQHNPANVDYFARLRALRAELGLQDAAIFLAEDYDGFVPDGVLADLYRFADALFLPSREEGFGIPLLEAALNGMPIFCSDIPVLRELAGEDAHYFEPDADPVQVANLVAHSLVTSPTARFGMRARAATWQQVYKQHIAPLLGKGKLKTEDG